MESVDTMRPPSRHAVLGRPSPVPPVPDASSEPPRLRPDVEALLDRSLTMIDLGRYESAARVALACMEEAPLDPRAYLLCAVAQQALGRFALAERLLRRVQMLDPGNAEAAIRLEMIVSRSRTP